MTLFEATQLVREHLRDVDKARYFVDTIELVDVMQRESLRLAGAIGMGDEVKLNAITFALGDFDYNLPVDKELLRAERVVCQRDGRVLQKRSPEDIMLWRQGQPANGNPMVFALRMKSDGLTPELLVHPAPDAAWVGTRADLTRGSLPKLITTGTFYDGTQSTDMNTELPFGSFGCDALALLTAINVLAKMPEDERQKRSITGDVIQRWDGEVADLIGRERDRLESFKRTASMRQRRW